MLYRQLAKIAIPATAKRKKRAGKVYASWIGRDGKRKINAEVLRDAKGREYCNVESAKWYARYTDSAGRRIQRCTGCTDKTAAQGVLNQWRGKSERVRAGYVRAADEHSDRNTPITITEVLHEYTKSLDRAGRNERHINYIKHVVNTVADNAGITRVIDLTRRIIEQHLAYLSDTPLSDRIERLTESRGASARTLNMHKALLHGFCAYAVRHGYIETNPAAHIQGANQATDRRHTRRALDDKEIAKLLRATEARPLANFLEKNRGAVDIEKVDSQTIAALQRRGRERMLIYKTLLCTAARWGELRAVTVADCKLTSKTPHIVLRAAHTKNKKTDAVPLTRDLAADLAAWLKETKRFGKQSLFDMPISGLKVLQRDLIEAGIPLETDAGVIDVHSIRHTAATRMAKNGIPVTVAQRILRHSDVRLTANVYTHIGLMDTTAAVENLPPLPDVVESDLTQEE